MIKHDLFSVVTQIFFFIDILFACELLPSLCSSFFLQVFVHELCQQYEVQTLPRVEA